MGLVTRPGVAWRHAVVSCSLCRAAARPGWSVAALLAVRPRNEPARSRDAVRVLDAARELHRDRAHTAQPAGAAGARRDPRGAAARPQPAARGGRLCAP